MTDVRLAPRGKARQKGAATLLVSIILLIAGTLVVLTGARTAVQEQQLAANDVRSRQALAAAQAGLDFAIARRMEESSLEAAENSIEGLRCLGVGSNETNEQEPNEECIEGDPTNDNSASAAFRVRFCDVDASPGQCPASPADEWWNANNICEGPNSSSGPVMVYACGWSDDRAARRPATTISARLDSYGGGTALPLVARGAADLMQGGAAIFNYYNDLTVWSGDGLRGQSMTGNTYIRDVESHPTPRSDFDISDGIGQGGCNNPPNGYVCSSQGSSVGHDVVERDISLDNLSQEAFFETFMGTDFDTYRDSIVSQRIDGDDTGRLAEMSGESIWIDGDVSIKEKIGSREEPVVLIVDGNLTLSAGAEIHGIVYVRDALTGTGGATVYGSMIVGDQFNEGATGSGNMNIVYDPLAVSNASQLGAATGAPGSWKDWVAE